MSMPVSAEATGLHVDDDLNGWTYIMRNFQHAGDWIPALHGKVQAALEPMARQLQRPLWRGCGLFDR